MSGGHAHPHNYCSISDISKSNFKFYSKGKIDEKSFPLFYFLLTINFNISQNDPRNK